jgi:hypothetical protein
VLRKFHGLAACNGLTWFGSLNSPVKGDDCGWTVWPSKCDEFAMLGRGERISPGWDGCNNGGKAIGISVRNPKVDDGPGRCWRIWQNIQFYKGQSGTYS